MVIASLMLNSFADPNLTPEALLPRMLWLRDAIGPRLERFLGYYRNPTTELAATLPCALSASFAVRPFRQYQELGLPARITGFRRAADGAAIATGAIDIQRKEVAIENDIGWRINTLVDFTAGRAPAITSTASDPATRDRLTAIIQAIFDTAGGAILLQQLVLHGAISGSAWVRICPTPELLQRLMNQTHQPAINNDNLPVGGGGAGDDTSDPDTASTGNRATPGSRMAPDISRWFRIEIVKASRLCPLPQGGEAAGTFSPGDPAPAYAAVIMDVPGAGKASGPALSAPGILDRVWSWFSKPTSGAAAEEFSFDLFGANHWQRYVRGMLTSEGDNPLGFVPFIRYENAAETAAGTGIGPAGSGAVDVGVGEVEPLIGLQDELNTRLSDRAYRVTMTSFRMWLGRGIEDFVKRPVGPGQMWATDNPEAGIDAFGGDASTPSEDSHIEDVREALDKISGIPPVAAGVLREKLGNLTSAVALQVTLIALLARTDRKRAALGQTLGNLMRRLLEVLDRAGIVASSSEDRGIDLNWPSALPEAEINRLQEAQLKVALGIPRHIVLSELGYAEVTPELPGGQAPVEARPVVPITPSTP